MLISFLVNGYKTFNHEAEISFNAVKSISNKDYVFKESNLLKSAIIYGPNNTGKTNFISALETLKKIVNNGGINDKIISEFDYNFFNEPKKITFKVKFIENNNIYNYSLEIEYLNGIVSEMLYVDDKLIFDRNNPDSNEKLTEYIKMFKQYKDKLVISMLSGDYKKYTDSFLSFFDKICILNKYINREEIILDVSNLTKEELNLFNKIIKSADISLDKIEYVDLDLGDKLNSLLKLVSHYKMNNIEKLFPTLLGDSDGTLAFIQYILKIIKLRRNGGLLVIDEIDRSLHTLLNKAIVSIFNSEDNKNIQLLATSHDLLLLDSKYLFRKDQIWFTYKDNKSVYFYSLNDFKANRSSVRNNTMESYLKGMFGALPHPNVEESFYD